MDPMASHLQTMLAFDAGVERSPFAARMELRQELSDNVASVC